MSAVRPFAASNPFVALARLAPSPATPPARPSRNSRT